MALDKPSQIRRVRTLVQTLCMSMYYGDVTIKMERGNIVCVELNENQRVSPEEAAKLLGRMEESGEDLYIRPVRVQGKIQTGIQQVRVSRKGSLEHMIPAGKIVE